MTLLNEIHNEVNETERLEALLAEGVELISEIETFLSESKISFNLKEAIGRDNVLPGEQPADIPASRFGAEAGLQNNIKELKKQLMFVLKQLKDPRVGGSSQAMKLQQKAYTLASKLGLSDEKIDQLLGAETVHARGV